MAVEIELKVRLDDPEPIKQRLSTLGTFCRSYEKNDAYWISTAQNIFPSGLRVRRERGVDGAGLIKAAVLVTYKTKENRDGIEVNDEREFAITGTEPADRGAADSAAVFEDLLGRLGLKPDIRKEKRGWAWNLGGQPPVLAELSLVKDLGWFLELEILAEDQEEGTVTESRNRLLLFLEKLDIPPERIERRPYTEMLRSLH
jgi:adenylate cyclase class 2